MTTPTFAAAYNNSTGSLRVSASHLVTVQPGPTTPQMGTLTFSGSLAEGDVFEVTIKGKTYSYTATQNDTNFDQIAQKLAAIINADTTLDVTAINGVASLQLVGDSNDAPFTVVSTVNGQLPELRWLEGPDTFTDSRHHETGTQVARPSRPDTWQKFPMALPAMLLLA